jgi:hypothetical protein
MAEKFNVLATTNTAKITEPKEISYEIIWAAERNPPKKAYLELLDQPAIIIVCTPNDDNINTYNKLNRKSQISAPSPKGNTTHPAIANPKVKIGAKIKSILLELFGTIDSLTNNLSPSAIG